MSKLDIDYTPPSKVGQLTPRGRIPRAADAIVLTGMSQLLRRKGIHVMSEALGLRLHLRETSIRFRRVHRPPSTVRT